MAAVKRAEALLHGASQWLILLSVRENNPGMPEKLKYCVYVLFSHADGKLYIGYTENLQQRLTAHFHG